MIRILIVLFALGATKALAHDPFIGAVRGFSDNNANEALQAELSKYRCLKAEPPLRAQQIRLNKSAEALREIVEQLAPSFPSYQVGGRPRPVDGPVKAKHLAYAVAVKEATAAERLAISGEDLRMAAAEEIRASYSTRNPPMSEAEKRNLDVALKDALETRFYFVLTEEVRDGKRFIALRPTREMAELMWRQYNLHEQILKDSQITIEPGNALGWFLLFGPQQDEKVDYRGAVPTLTLPADRVSLFPNENVEQNRATCAVGFQTILAGEAYEKKRQKLEEDGLMAWRDSKKTNFRRSQEAAGRKPEIKPTEVPKAQTTIAATKPQVFAPANSRVPTVQPQPAITMKPTAPAVVAPKPEVPTVKPAAPTVQPPAVKPQVNDNVPARMPLASSDPVVPEIKPHASDVPAKPEQPTAEVPQNGAKPVTIFVKVPQGTEVGAFGSSKRSDGSAVTFTTEPLEAGAKYWFYFSFRGPDGIPYINPVIITGGYDNEVVWDSPPAYVGSPCSPGYRSTGYGCRR